ncbi:hypothetical protein H0A65_04665 [Alcaligenaceae bacterium]|nr:hypothetical protein [Alcaligenaceae bacterium]
MAEPKTITIDNQPYELDQLTEHARAQIINLRVVDGEIAKTEQRLTIFKAARAAYAQALKAELDKATA